MTYLDNLDPTPTDYIPIDPLIKVMPRPASVGCVFGSVVESPLPGVRHQMESHPDEVCSICGYHHPGGAEIPLEQAQARAVNTCHEIAKKIEAIG